MSGADLERKRLRNLRKRKRRMVQCESSRGFQKYATIVDSLAISPGSVTDLEKILEEILEGASEEDVTLVRCVTVNPVEKLPTLEDGEPHDCVQKAEKYSRHKKEEVQETLDEQKRNTIQPGDKVFVKVFRRKWYNERREGPFEVVRSTGTAVQVKGSPTWYHFSHCVKAPSDELPCSQNHDEGPRQSEENAGQCEEAEMHKDLQSQISEDEIVHGVDNVDDVVYISDDARNDSAGNGQERRFGDIDFQYVPETAESISVECEAPKGTKGSNSATGAFGGSVRRRSPRPVRKRVRPKRYEN
ncbi:hypothetical protein MHYP_G00216760 [Metynnis hypsauchen]